MINLRRCGYSIVFLGKIFGCDHKTVHSQLEKYGIPTPEEEYTLGNIILYALKVKEIPTTYQRRLLRVNNTLVNMGKRTYQDYLDEHYHIPKGSSVKFVII